MNNSRRGFLRKAAITGAVVASTSTVAAIASSNKKGHQDSDYNGVVIGKSNKKEILYKKSLAWDEYYKRAL